MDFEFGCEECGTENEDLFDTILDNKSLRLCERCARANNALILREEKEKNREKWNSRNSKKPEQTYKEEPKVTLQGLWDRYKQKMGERNTLEKQKEMAVLEEKKFLEDLEKQKKLENAKKLEDFWRAKNNSVFEHKQIVQAIESDFNPDAKIEAQEKEAFSGHQKSEGFFSEEKSFNKEASKKVDIRGFFKQTFKFLKGREKKEGNSEEIPQLIPDLIVDDKNEN